LLSTHVVAFSLAGRSAEPVLYLQTRGATLSTQGQRKNVAVRRIVMATDQQTQLNPDDSKNIAEPQIENRLIRFLGRCFVRGNAARRKCIVSIHM
jgi:hypothetical protein